jgi:Nuclease-related domain
MPSAYSQLIYFGTYFLLFCGGVLGWWTWQIKRRKEKPPVEFKMLRGPGESLRRRMVKFDEEVVYIVGGSALAPLVVGLAVLKLLVWVRPHLRLDYEITIVAAAFLIAVVFACRFVMRRLSRYRNDRLGYLGERAVGEALAPLLADGYRVFHDIPAEADGARFNVDHVVVGPTGVFAIETKTRRKGRARPGYEVHKVAYDGRKLIWPWGDDYFGLNSAFDRTRWLTEWLHKKTGLGLVAQPVLVLPGWYVVPQGEGPVFVLNHKMLPGRITRTNGSGLSPEHIDLISRQLDEVCRDVVD